MKKSKFVFIILAVVYALMALLYPFDVLKIGENLLFALSVSALLISTSDIFNKVGMYLYTTNTYNADLKVTIDFLDYMIKNGFTNTRNMNVRNVKENYDELLKKNYTFCHPSDYAKKKILAIINVVTLILFILGITAFIIIPFIDAKITDSKMTSIITILAFSSMALGLFFDELIDEKQVEINALLSEKHLVINAEYPTFRNYFESNMYYRNDLKASQELVASIIANQTTAAPESTAENN